MQRIEASIASAVDLRYGRKSVQRLKIADAFATLMAQRIEMRSKAPDARAACNLVR